MNKIFWLFLPAARSGSGSACDCAGIYAIVSCIYRLGRLQSRKEDRLVSLDLPLDSELPWIPAILLVKHYQSILRGIFWFYPTKLIDVTKLTKQLILFPYCTRHQLKTLRSWINSSTFSVLITTTQIFLHSNFNLA